MRFEILGKEKCPTFIDDDYQKKKKKKKNNSICNQGRMPKAKQVKRTGDL